MTDPQAHSRPSGWLRTRDPALPVPMQWFFTRLFWACLAPLVLLAAGLAWERVHAVQSRQDTLAAQLAADVLAQALGHLGA